MRLLAYTAATALAATAATIGVVYWLLGHAGDTLTHTLIPGD